MSALSVTFPFKDKDGEYEVSATVYSSGFVNIYDIRTEDNSIADIEDWSASERSLMKGLAIKAAKELDNQPEDEDTDNLLDDEDANWERE